MASPANEAEWNNRIEGAPMPLQKIPISKRAVDWFFGYDYFIALNPYSEIFTPEDLDALEQSNLKPNSYAVTATERRSLRALAVITKAKRMTQSGSLASLTANDLKNPQFTKLVFASWSSSPTSSDGAHARLYRCSAKTALCSSGTSPSTTKSL